MKLRNPSLGIALLALAYNGMAHATDLLGVYHEAVLHDAQYASARATLEMGRESLAQGRSLLLPTVSINGSTSRNYFDSPPVSRKVINYNTDTYTLNISQPIYRKYNYASYVQSKFRFQASEAQFATAQQDLIVRTAQAYFDLLLAQDNVRLSQAQKAAISEQLKQAKRLREAGVGTVTDVNEAEARFDSISAQEISALNTVEIRSRALQRITGKRPDDLLTVGDKLRLVAPDPNNVDKWIDAASTQDPQIALQQATVDYLVQEVEKNRAANYPTVDFVLNSSYAHAPNYFNFGKQKMDSYIVQFNLPMYQGGYNNSRVRESLFNEEKARDDLEDAKRNSALQTSQNFFAVTSTIAQVKALEQAVVSSESLVHSTKMEYEVGLRTSADVLNAQQQLYTAKRDLSQARYTYIISRLKLKASIGTLDEKDVALVNQWLGAEQKPDELKPAAMPPKTIALH